MSTAPNSLPYIRSSAKPGTGIDAGRSSARPSAFESSRLVTGLGAVELIDAAHLLVVERPEQDPDLVLDVDPGDVLVAAGERAADAELERRQQLAEEAAVGVEDVAGADDRPGARRSPRPRAPPLSHSRTTSASKPSPGAAASSTIASPRSP